MNFKVPDVSHQRRVKNVKGIQRLPQVCLGTFGLPTLSKKIDSKSLSWMISKTMKFMIAVKEAT